MVYFPEHDKIKIGSLSDMKMVLNLCLAVGVCDKRKVAATTLSDVGLTAAVAALNKVYRKG